MKHSMILLSMVILLTACGAKYEPTYSYQMPQSESGKACVAQCVESQQTCQDVCQERRGDANGCECDDEYRACYELCGGKVKVATHCVVNCFKMT